MSDEEDRRLGQSGVFQKLVMSARKFTRAITGAGEEPLAPEILELGNQIAQAFVAKRFVDVHKLGTSGLKKRVDRVTFESQWRQIVEERGDLTSYEVSNHGHIDLGFIPGLEDVDQKDFVAFLEIVFGTPTVPLDDEKAFTIGAVLLDDEGTPRVGAIHTR